jgi:hypothetical protein
MLTVKTVQVLSQNRLEILLSNGKTIRPDVSGWLAAPGCELLAEAGVFNAVAVSAFGHGVEWPELDVDIGIETLVRIEREQNGKAFPTEAFNDWLRRNGLSLTEAAQALGVTRRTVIYYHTGQKPIPPIVRLACLGFDSECEKTKKLQHPGGKRPRVAARVSL